MVRFIFRLSHHLVMRKGQTAIEYLMTYGWAILIILVVGGVLYYYGVFSPSKLVGKSKTGFQQVDLVDWEVNAGTSANISVLLENRVGTAITVQDATVETANAVFNDVGGVETAVNITEGARDTAFRTISGTGQNLPAGSSYQLDLTIIYRRQDTVGTLRSSGRISGVVG